MYANIQRLQLVKDRSVLYAGAQITSPAYVAELIRGAFNAHEIAEECVWLLCLDTANKIAGIHEISHGTSNASIVEPRDLFKRALLNNAVGIILVHNHPSETKYPSVEDDIVTERVKAAGELLNIQLLDHIIIAYDDEYSYKSAGRL